MNTHIQSGGDGYWYVTVTLADRYSYRDDEYIPLPNLDASAASRNRNRAFAYALELLAQQLKESSR